MRDFILLSLALVAAALVKAEMKARNQHLYACGARTIGIVDALLR